MSEREEIDIMREKLNELIDSHNKMQRHLELTRAMWSVMASEPWVRFFMWIRPLHMPVFFRETVYPLRKITDRAPELPPLEDVPPEAYDFEENAIKRVPKKVTRRKQSISAMAKSVRNAPD